MRARMIYTKAAFILYVSLLLAGAAQCRQKGEKISPEGLLARARSEEILWTKGTPPTLMSATLQLRGGKNGPVGGEYSFYWASPSQWREELKLGTYYRTRVGGEKGYWQASNLEYQPEIVFEFDKLLSVKGALRFAEHENLTKVHVRREGAVLQDCSDVKGKFGRVSTLCFDDSTGELLSVDYRQNLLGISRIEYSFFKTVDGKSIPFVIHGFHGREPTLVMTITKVEPMPEHDAGLFQLPGSSQFWPSCDGVIDPEPVHMVLPDAGGPVEFTKSVTLYLLVGTDGLPSRIAVIDGGDPELDRAAIKAARQWRYKPAMCGNSPVPAEISTILTVSVGR
jgi:TonB family protein